MKRDAMLFLQDIFDSDPEIIWKTIQIDLPAIPARIRQKIDDFYENSDP